MTVVAEILKSKPDTTVHTVRPEDSVLDALRRMRLARFIRVKDEVNKEAILNEPEAVVNVPGISIIQGEDFIVQPFEAELAEGV